MHASLGMTTLVHTQGIKLPEIGSYSMLLPFVVSDASLVGRRDNQVHYKQIEMMQVALPLSSSSSGPSYPSLVILASSSECQQTTLLPLSKLSILWPLSCSQLADYTSSGDPSQHYSTFSSDHLWSAGQQPVGSQKGVLGDKSPPFTQDDPASVGVFLGSTIPLCLHRSCSAPQCSSCCPNEIHTGDYPKTFCDKPL